MNGGGGRVGGAGERLRLPNGEFLGGISHCGKKAKRGRNGLPIIDSYTNSFKRRRMLEACSGRRSARNSCSHMR